MTRSRALSLHVLTGSLPGYLVRYREESRSLLILVSLLLIVSTLWLPQERPFATGSVLPVLAAIVFTFTASLIPALHPLLNRFAGLLILLEIHILIAVTGGQESPYTPLYMMLLIYGAVFYDSRRVILTGILILASTSAQRVTDGATLEVSDVSALLVEVMAGAFVAVVVHELMRRLREEANTDGLTGLTNHATFWQMLQAQHDRAQRYGGGYSLLLADIDHFKRVNDVHGHRTGDRVLAGIAELLRSRVRATDELARYGGEEFAIVLPETGEADALALAEDLRACVASADLSPPTTISIGVAAAHAHREGETAEQVLQRADAALYAAKRDGRNRVAGAPGVEAAWTTVAAPAPASLLAGAPLTEQTPIA